MTEKIKKTKKKTIEKDMKSLECINNIVGYLNNPETIKHPPQLNDEDLRLIRAKASKIVEKLSSLTGTTYEHSMTGMCALFQCGAHLRSVNNRIIKIGNYEFTKKDLQYAANQAKNEYQFRKIARSINDIIVYISYYYNIPGHLYKKFSETYIPQLNEPDNTKLYKAYAADFQLNNPKIPIPVKQFLVKRLQDKKNNK